jgi:hypothetical protein
VTVINGMGVMLVPVVGDDVTGDDKVLDEDAAAALVSASTCYNI